MKKPWSRGLRTRGPRTRATWALGCGEPKAKHIAALGPADAASPTQRSPFGEQTACPLPHTHGPRQSRLMDRRAAWPSPRARPGLRVTLPTCLPLGRLLLESGRGAAAGKTAPRVSASSSRLTVRGRAPGEGLGQGAPLHPCVPPSPSRQTVLGRMGAAVRPERSVTSWGLGWVHWGLVAPHSLGVHQCAQRPCFPDQLSLTAVFPADPSRRQVTRGWRGHMYAAGESPQSPWPGDTLSMPQALGPLDGSPAHEGGQVRLQGAGGARPWTPGTEAHCPLRGPCELRCCVNVDEGTSSDTRRDGLTLAESSDVEIHGRDTCSDSVGRAF